MTIAITKVIILLFLIVYNKCFCDICSTCVCTVSNAGPIINCHDKRLGTNEILNFDLSNLNKHQYQDELILSKNNTVVLPTNELNNLKHLKKLDLSLNKFDSIYFDAFKDLDNLEELDYSHNLLWGFDISILNMIPSLLKLNLSHNQINNLERSSKNVTAKLKILDLSYNNLISLNNLDLPKLEYLDLSFNKLTTLPTDSLHLLQNLNIFYINNNHLLSLNLENLPLSLLELDARANLIDTLSFQSKLPIRTLYVQNNQISRINKNLTLMEKLETLNISGNSLPDFPDIFLKYLETLDLSFNNLVTIPETVSTENFPSLKSFYVSGNHLNNVKIWSKLNLESFEVNFVDTIKEIGKEDFLMLKEKNDGCINVTVSNNMRLNTIRANIFQHMNVCSLDLSNNRFAYLPSELFNVNAYNKNISKEKYLVNLQGNPFICNCSLQWMLDELIPSLYATRPSLLENLRCAGPPLLVNKRIIHWYKWEGKVFCDDLSYFAENMSINIESISLKQKITFETSTGMVAILATAIAFLALLMIIGILLTRRMITKRRRVNRRF